MKSKKHLSALVAATMLVSSVAPVMAATTSSETITGNDRHETAVKISKEGWKSSETVILVNSSAIPDALTATPLAHAKKAPILLTGKDGLNKETANEIKRLGAKDVIMIGGDAVLSAKVEKDLKALKVKVDRIKGETREETALAIAKRLDGIKDVYEIAVVNGTTGLADAVSVAAAAAEKGMPILLANPKKGLSVAEKFIKDEAIKASFVIGGKTVLPEKLVSSLPGKQRIEGLDRKDTNAKVIEKFYTGKELNNVYLAKDGMGDSGQLIDALAVGALAAKNGAPVLIASKKLSEKQIDVINTKKIDTITQVGGKGNEGAFNQLKDIEETDVYEVGTVEELKEALEKANANDKIVLKPNATITEDIIINTDKNVDIKVEGTVTGKVEITAPNGNVTDNSTSKPSGGGSTGGTITPSDTVAPEIEKGRSVIVDFTTAKADVNVVPNGTVEFNTGDTVESIKIKMNEAVKVVGNVKVNNGTEEFGTVKVDTDGKTLVITPNSKNISPREYDFKIVSDASNYISDLAGNKLAADTGIVLTFINTENIAVVSDEKALKEALNNKKSFIKIKESFEITNSIEPTVTTTIDFNNNTVTQKNTTGSGDIIIINTDSITVDLKNGTIKNEDSTDGSEHIGVFVKRYKKNITVNMKDFNIKMGGSKYTIDSEGKVDSNHGNSFGVYANGLAEDIIINMDHCNISGADLGIYYPVKTTGKSVLNIINNSNISGGTALGVKGGTVNISDSTLVAIGETSEKNISLIEPNYDGISEAGEALCISGVYNRLLNVNVKNSIFKSSNGYGIRMQFMTGEQAERTLNIESGNFEECALGSIFKNHANNIGKKPTNKPEYDKTEYNKVKEAIKLKGGTYKYDVKDCCEDGYTTENISGDYYKVIPATK